MWSRDNMIYLIKRPLITEKNSRMGEDKVYAFEVDKKATKTQIKEAVEKLFQVKVRGVRTAICRGRSRKTRHGLSHVPYWKKALVKVDKNETISLFEGV